MFIIFMSMSINNNILLCSILSLNIVFQCGPKTTGVFGESIVEEDKNISVRRSNGVNRFGNWQSHTSDHTIWIQRLHSVDNRSSSEYHYGFWQVLKLNKIMSNRVFGTSVSPASFPSLILKSPIYFALKINMDWQDYYHNLNDTV